MQHSVIHLNLIAAWIGVALGFLSGALLGLGFQIEKWLGGYTSFKRRLYRLGHISFFGLALMNWMFYMTAASFPAGDPRVLIASAGFILGALTMPVCCVLMAHYPKTHSLFALPVVSLSGAAALTLSLLIKP